MLLKPPPSIKKEIFQVAEIDTTKSPCTNYPVLKYTQCKQLIKMNFLFTLTHSFKSIFKLHFFVFPIILLLVSRCNILHFASYL